MKCALTVLSLCIAFLSLSQNKGDTIYFDKGWAVTSLADSAWYYRIINEADGLYYVSDYYIHTDTLQMTGAFKDAEQTIKDGDFVYYTRIGGVSSKASYKDGKLNGEKVYYTDNGKLSSTEGFLDGMRHGDFVVYYENGVIKRKETYDHGNITAKACYLENGKETDYFPYETPASYPGGKEGIRKYIIENLNYPKDAQKKRIEGRVLIQFVVSTTGEVTTVKVKQSVHPLLDDEALRIIREMPKWTPGMIDGKPVNSVFSLPITFQMRK